MFGVFAIDEILCYRGNRFPGSPVPALYATLVDSDLEGLHADSVIMLMFMIMMMILGMSMIILNIAIMMMMMSIMIMMLLTIIWMICSGRAPYPVCDDGGSSFVCS